jgi:hypothetical protein
MSKRRPVRVYRLDVTYPPGSLEPGWEPPGWDPLETDTDWVVTPDDDMAWAGWPKNRLYLSASSAQRRANRFRKYGATVEVERSELVLWPGEGLIGDRGRISVLPAGELTRRGQ